MENIRITRLIIVPTLVLVLYLVCVLPVYAISIMVHVPEKYTDVEAGERFYFELEIKYPENPKRKDLRLNYNITDQDNNPIAKAKYLKAIETQASFMDYIVIPESAKRGLYDIGIEISDYDDLRTDVSASFNVTPSVSEQAKIYFFILLGLILFIGVFVVMNMFALLRRKV